MGTETRHRLLEGVLLRLARRPDAGEFVLRGGLLIRHWLHPLPRPADDLDLVATFPYDVGATATRILETLADEGVPDGVCFDLDEARAEGIWLDSGNPGVRVFVCGTVGGDEDDTHIDVTFGPPPRPAAVFGPLPTASGHAAHIWMCRPEAVIGHKVQALLHRGHTGWRPKDLNDLRLLLARVPFDASDLRAAITAYVADVGRTAAEARSLFGPTAWWGTKAVAARWRDFADETGGLQVPHDLAAVVAGVAQRLNPVLEGA
jgi:hypothetical protein